ncbi:unnamed protein product, partial [Prorocentrum cordatum]
GDAGRAREGEGAAASLGAASPGTRRGASAEPPGSERPLSKTPAAAVAVEGSAERPSTKAPGATRHPRRHLGKGSRDDSFLSTITESSESSSTNTGDSKVMAHDGSRIEVFSEADRHEASGGVLADFRQLSAEVGEQMQQRLRTWGWEKPLAMQRRVLPLVMGILRQDEQKSFVTVQGAPQCGKTSALVLGLLGAIGIQGPPGLRAVVLSTSTSGDFRKYFGICGDIHPARLACFNGGGRRVTFEGLPPEPDEALKGTDPVEDLRQLSATLGAGEAPAVLFGHPARLLPLLREAPSWGVDLSGIQILALDDAEETIRLGFMDEVCEVCTILRHFSRQRLRHVVLSEVLTHEAKSMVRCLRNSLLRQQNLFGIRAHLTQARARSVNHYYAVAPRARWPVALAALHHTLALPSGIIFDDESPEERASACAALRGQAITASVWNALQEQGSGARAAARDGRASVARGPAFHIMPSDRRGEFVDLPQVRCVLHFEVPRRELSLYGLRLMCLEQGGEGRGSRHKGGTVSVLFVEEAGVVRELEKTFGVQMQEVPTEMLVSGRL